MLPPRLVFPCLPQLEPRAAWELLSDLDCIQIAKIVANKLTRNGFHPIRFIALHFVKSCVSISMQKSHPLGSADDGSRRERKRKGAIPDRKPNYESLYDLQGRKKLVLKTPGGKFLHE